MLNTYADTLIRLMITLLICIVVLALSRYAPGSTLRTASPAIMQLEAVPGAAAIPSSAR